jgi:hypothetical protein
VGVRKNLRSSCGPKGHKSIAQGFNPGNQAEHSGPDSFDLQRLSHPTEPPLYAKTTVTRLEEYRRSRASETTLTMLVSHLSCDAKLERSFRFDPIADSETILKVIYG